MTDDPVYNAEAILLSWGDTSRSGMTVTFRLDDGPDGVTENPFKALSTGVKAGQHFQLCAIPILDGETRAALTDRQANAAPEQPESEEPPGPGALPRYPAGKPISKRHSWGDPERHEHHTDQPCLKCGIIKRHRKEYGKDWTVFGHMAPEGFEPQGYGSDNTPPCPGQLAREHD